MTDKFKKSIAFVVVFMMIISANIGSYATIIQGDEGPGDMINLGEQEVPDTSGLLEEEEAAKEEETPKVEEPVETLLEYTIVYLIKDTEESVPGLNSEIGIGKLGALIIIG